MVDILEPYCGISKNSVLSAHTIFPEVKELNLKSTVTSGLISRRMRQTYAYKQERPSD
jgi:hypothetical protein